ncbi:MAG: hypothetical protein JW840_07135 [Candidatus Thermoplasmatota archaeon]|nr:hypothetical protein [Candidatus Thermoplasmatota archaeon]
MKILYGVCGEGRGHASRSKILIHFLEQKGHQIRIVAGGKAYALLSGEFDNVLQIESPKGFYRANQVRILYTILHTLYQTAAHTPRSFLRIRSLIKEFQPDILITDAEPISHFAARFSRIKRISIDNPSAILYRKYQKRVRDYPAWLFLFFALKISVFGADKYIIYDFFDKQSNNPRVLFVKPLIQPGIRSQAPYVGSHVFVYQTSSSFTTLFNSLRKLNEPFIIYGFNKEETDGNLVFKRFNENEFYHDISTSKAVLVNGGFTVISEALYLKKPIFSLPIRHQFEQVFNARCVERMGAGVCHVWFREEDLKEFIGDLDVFSESLQNYDAGNQEEVLTRIEQTIQDVLNQKK